MNEFILNLNRRQKHKQMHMFGKIKNFCIVFKKPNMQNKRFHKLLLCIKGTFDEIFFFQKRFKGKCCNLKLNKKIFYLLYSPLKKLNESKKEN
jgi:hypothetical protein